MALAIETIHYQYKDDFPEALTDILSSIYRDIDGKKYSGTRSLVDKSEHIQHIEKLIHDRFGMTVVFDKELHVLSPAAIIPFFGDYFRDAKGISQIEVSSVKGAFSSGYLKAVQRLDEIGKDKAKMLRSLHDRTGYINLKLARVGGYLSDIRHYLIIDFFLLKQVGIQPVELTAIILHELGHAFDGLEEHNRLETTNRAILDILNDLRDNKPEKALYRFKNKFTKEEFEKASLETNKERYDFCGKLALAYLGEVKSQILDKKYNETNFENMADTFATRFGMGDALVTGLNKFHKAFGLTIPNSRTVFALMYLLEAMALSTVFIAVPVVGPVVYAAFIFFLAGTAKEDMTYDLPVDRYVRIRNTLVNGLKNKRLPKDVLKDMLDQYETVSRIIEDTGYVQSMTHILADIVVPSNRRAKYYIDLQQLIEKNLNNELFVKSAQLKVL